MSVQRHLFVSPHLDDVALSCGGTVALLRNRGREVTVVTLFVGEIPNAERSEFAEQTIRLWGGHPTPLELRMSEEMAALRVLGVDAETNVWPGQYPDAPFRRHPVEKRWLYTSNWALFRVPDPSEADIPHRIAGEISTLVDTGTRVYIPLGLGNHVDHMLASAAGRILAGQGVEVVWYEDYPYAERDARVSRLEARGWRPLLVPLSDREVEAKIRAILCYRSQIPSLFGREREVRRRIIDYMMTVSGRGYPAERFWEAPQGG